MAAGRLLRKAANGTLEVEHLLKAARTPSLALADEVDRLISELGWRESSVFPEVPWFEWATVVTTFCRKGFGGLTELGSNRHYLPFAVGLMEELHDSDALTSLIQLLPLYRSPVHALEAHRLAAGLNLLGMRAPHPASGSSDQTRIRDFLHSVLATSASDAQRGTVLCALRYFGDRSSLGLVDSVPIMSEAWEPTRAAAKRAIEQRLTAAITPLA
jgi:hypothetical protein